MILIGLTWALMGAAARDADPININTLVYVLVAVVGSSALTALLTRAATNRKLEAEGENLQQQAIKAVEERGAQYVATMDKIRKVLEERLAATERDLAEAKRGLEVMEERWRSAQLDVSLAVKERQRVLAEAEGEREKLRQRIEELEFQVEDLRRQLPGKRHKDPPPIRPQE